MSQLDKAYGKPPNRQGSPIIVDPTRPIREKERLDRSKELLKKSSDEIEDQDGLHQSPEREVKSKVFVKHVVNFL